MKHLIIAVSLDSSLDLLEPYADIFILDEDSTLDVSQPYESIYIRSHFSHPSFSPEVFRNEIEDLVQSVMNINQSVKFIDNMSNVDAIIAFEDKWSQYETFGDFMPNSALYVGKPNDASFAKPIFKKRLSSRGSGVTWNSDEVSNSNDEWIIQESLDIKEELRVYAIRNSVYPICAIKRSMTDGRSAHSVDTRPLTPDETENVLSVIKCAPGLDMVGIDIARTLTGEMKVIEVNRSPGFAKFHELTGINLADELYAN